MSAASDATIRPPTTNKTADFSNELEILRAITSQCTAASMRTGATTGGYTPGSLALMITHPDVAASLYVP